MANTLTSLRARWASLSTSSRRLILFCSFGFLIGFKPSEAFLSVYLRDEKGFSDQQLYQDIYPWWLYFYLFWLLVLGAFADVISYKVAVVVGVVGREMTRFLLLWGTTLAAMQFMQVCFALGSAAEVTYFAYVFAVVPPQMYQRASGMLRASGLVAHVGSAVLGQLLYLHAGVSLVALFFVSLVSVSIATVISLAFPRVDSTPVPLVSSQHAAPGIAHHHGDGDGVATPSSTLPSDTAWPRLLIASIRSAYTGHPGLLRWSGVTVAMFCVHNILVNFIMTYFQVIDPSVQWNGYVEAAARLSGAAAAFLPHYLQRAGADDQRPRLRAVSRAVDAEPTLAAAAACGFLAAMCYLLALTHSVYLAFMAYILYYAAAEAFIVLTSARIAVLMTSGRFAATFSFNMLLSLLVSVLLQALIGPGAAALSLPAIFLVFAVLLSFLTLAMVLARLRLGNTMDQLPDAARDDMISRSAKRSSLGNDSDASAPLLASDLQIWD